MKILFFKAAFLVILINICCMAASAYAQLSPTTAAINWEPTTVYSGNKCQTATPSSSVPNWQPGPCDYSDWIDVKAMGAKGDGVTDDTAAIQSALNQVQGAESYSLPYDTVYFPPGIYVISSTLTITNATGIALIGSGSATTILWKGASGGTMYLSNGATQTRYVGISWDGNNSAAIGIDHRSTTLYETRIRHEQETFKNFTNTAVRIGYQQQVATAETFFLNDIFENNGIGVSFLDADDYDEKILKTVFINNGFGIYNYGGIVTVGETNFYQNTSDIYSPSEQIRLRSVTSQGSGQFLLNSGATFNLQNCRVSDWGSVSKWTFEHAFPAQPTAYGDAIFTWLQNNNYLSSNVSYYGYVIPNLNLPASLTALKNQYGGTVYSTILGLLQQAQSDAANGAVLLDSSQTVTIFDNAFSNSNPSALSPIQMLNSVAEITSYNNSWNGPVNIPLILPEQPLGPYFAKIINIPGSTTLGNLYPNFVDSTFNTPSVVFNVNTFVNTTACPAKTITGLSQADYTCAAQAAINAAITANNSSMAVGAGPAAYFPNNGGRYISSPIQILNANNITIMGSSGMFSGVTWSSNFTGSEAFNVIDPVNVKIEHITIGGSSSSSMVSILQSSSSLTTLSNIIYDGVYENSGLSLSNLSNKSSVHLIDLEGNLTSSGSCQANIFMDFLEGSVTLSGSGLQPVGYFNIDYMDTGGYAFDVTVNDNQNLTIGYLYDENNGGEVGLYGTPAESVSPGHVTISGDRELGAPTQTVINGYTGDLSILNTKYFNSKGNINILASTGATSILFLNNTFASVPAFSINPSSSVMALQNYIADTALSPAITQAQSALNDLRALANNNLSQIGYNQG